MKKAYLGIAVGFVVLLIVAVAIMLVLRQRAAVVRIQQRQAAREAAAGPLPPAARAERSAAVAADTEQKLMRLYAALARAIQGESPAEFEKIHDLILDDARRVTPEASPLDVEMLRIAAEQAAAAAQALNTAQTLRRSIIEGNVLEDMPIELPERKLGYITRVSADGFTARIIGGKEPQSYRFNTPAITEEFSRRATRKIAEPGVRFYTTLLFGFPEDQHLQYAPDDFWRKVYPLIVSEFTRQIAPEKSSSSNIYTFEQLDQALVNGRTTEFLRLADAGADLKQTDDRGRTLLFSAAREGDEAAIRRLLEAGVEVNACDDLGHYALLLAVRQGHFNAVRLLLDNGASTRLPSPSGRLLPSETEDKNILNLLKIYGDRNRE